MIERIPYGGHVTQHSTLTANGEQWSYVTYNNNTGYIMTKFLTSVPPQGSGNVSHPQDKAQAFGTSNLRKGQTSYYVKNVQLALKHLGYLNDSADGIFGTNTFNAVKSFQSAYNLTSDGIVGANTKTALWSAAGSYLMTNGVTQL